MIFNHTGRLYKQDFVVDNLKLDVVNTFCYLGFDVKASGVVSAAIETLYQKTNKAMRPIKGAVARFNIPIKTSMKLFHSYIEPILLYTTENWMALSDKSITKFTNKTIFDDIGTKKIDILHRQFLKYIIGTSKSCPNLAVYGDTGELPLSLKAYRQMLRFWYRVKNLSNERLVKIALLESIELRTNWIVTIEKLVSCLGLTEVIDSPKKFNIRLEKNIKNMFIDYWKDNLRNPGPRLEFYSKIKQDLSFEPYLDLLNFEPRKEIAKIRCSDHALEIEKARHNKDTNRDETLRLCRVCRDHKIENEEHFLMECTHYENIRTKYNIANYEDCVTLMREMKPEILGKYLLEAWAERKMVIDPPLDSQEQL